MIVSEIQNTIIVTSIYAERESEHAHTYVRSITPAKRGTMDIPTSDEVDKSTNANRRIGDD